MPRPQGEKDHPVAKSSRLQVTSDSDWPANQPDLSQLDFSTIGIFKRRLWKRHALDLTGLMLAMRERWKKIKLGLDQCII